jgi:periplasmic copper chaperone A
MRDDAANSPLPQQPPSALCWRQAAAARADARRLSGTGVKEPTMLKLITLAGILIFAAAAPVRAQSAPIAIDHPWSRATAGQVGVVYMTIKNTGTADDRLIGAATPIAGKAELHTTSEENGVMKMRPLPAVEVKANAEASLKPGGMHLMLLGLKEPLKEGNSFPLSLTFEKAGKLDVTVSVEKAGAMGSMKM